MKNIFSKAKLILMLKKDYSYSTNISEIIDINVEKEIQKRTNMSAE